MNVHDGGFKEEKLAFIDPDQAEKLSNVELFPGDVLINITGASVARCCIVDASVLPARVNQHVSILRPVQNLILPQYLQYFLISPGAKSLLLKIGEQGATRQAITKSQLQDFEINHPKNLTKQEEIVEVLDKAFAAIDQAKANIEQNIANAKELFQSKLNQIFSQKGDGWEETTLESLTKFSSGGTPSKKEPDYWTGEIPWVSGKDMKSDRIGDSILHVSKIAVTDKATRLAPPGSLLILVRGMGLANGVAIAELTSPCTFNQDIKAIHPDPKVHPRFLLFSLNASFADSRNILSRAAHGTLKIEMDNLKNTSVSFPALREQEAIVAKVDKLSALTRETESTYQCKLVSLEELKKSILQKAFAGELT